MTTGVDLGASFRPGVHRSLHKIIAIYSIHYKHASEMLQSAVRLRLDAIVYNEVISVKGRSKHLLIAGVHGAPWLLFLLI